MDHVTMTDPDYDLAEAYDEAAREAWARRTVAKAGKDWASHMAKFSGAVVPRETNWDDYRKCSQVCRAEMGKPCFSLSGTIRNGRPDGIRHELDQPHSTRKRRTRKTK